MAREKLDPKRRGLNGYQGFFLALTLVVMIIIILTTKELTTAILLIGLITNFLIISSQLTLLGDRHVAGAHDNIDRNLANTVMVQPVLPRSSGSSLLASLSEGMEPVKRERFTTATTAPPGAGPPAITVTPPTSNVAPYPGAIDFGGQHQGPDGSDQALALGHVDWNAEDRDTVPVGNPYDTDRIANPQAAGPCVDDDAIAIYDGDELLAYQARSRNDPERVWAGITRRKALVERYVKEELDEKEASQWWGNHEV